MQRASIREATSTLGRRILLTAPVISAFVLVGVVLLHAYAPLEYAADFSTPTAVASGLQPGEYSVARVGRGWGMVAADRLDRLVYTRFTARGHKAGVSVLDGSALGDTAPVLVRTGTATLAVWVSAAGQNATRLAAATLDGARIDRFTAVRPTGTVENPYAFPISRTLVDVVFSWQHAGFFDVYLATISTKSNRVVLVRRLVPAVGYGFYPRAAVDGEGNIDLVYMDTCCNGQLWQVYFRRFTSRGVPLGPRATLSSIHDLTPASGAGVVIPSQWGLDVIPGRQGTVWGAWDANNQVILAHWNRNGGMITQGAIFAGGMDLTKADVQLALWKSGGVAFFTGDDGIQTNVTSVAFDATGRPGKVEQVEYAGGVTVLDPIALSFNGIPRIFWQQIPDRSVQATLVSTNFGTRQAPDLAAQLGINVGNPWEDLIILGGGAMVAGAPLTIANFLILAVLIAIWFPASRLIPEPYQWFSYLGAVVGILCLGLATHTIVSSAIMAIQPFRLPYGLLVVAGAAFAAYWVGSRGLKNLDGIFRASLMALTAFYFIAFMAALTGIQSELSQL